MRLASSIEHSARFRVASAGGVPAVSVYGTRKLRALDPTKTIADALRTYADTGRLPPLPDTNVADG